MENKKISKRISKFRESLIKTIPRKPNNKDTLKLLQDKSLMEIILIYLNWAARVVPARNRRIVIEPSLTSDKRWKSLSSRINALFEKVRNSEDLTSHLSLKANKDGFCPYKIQPDGMIDSWSDKDFLLNIMGYHHFHLDTEFEINEVLFAEVTRETFTAIGIFDHSVFEDSRDSKKLTIEREKLWQLFDERSSRKIPPGSFYCPHSIALSGHREAHLEQARHYEEFIREYDAKLDNPDFLSEIFGCAESSQVSKLKPEWHLNHSDLGVLDEQTNVFCSFISDSKV